MRRRDFLKGSAAAAGVAAAGWSISGAAARAAAEPGGRLTPPRDGKVLVAVTISEGVTVIDFTGPWEVFQDAHVSELGGAYYGRAAAERTAAYMEYQSKGWIV